MTPHPAGHLLGAFDLRRFSLTLALALAAYWACLQFVFPGYFSPLDPLHSDYYLVPGITADGEPLWEKLNYPRPLGFLFLWTIGHLGLQGATAVLVAITLLNAALLVELWRRLAPFALSWWAVAIYLASLFAHPQFYLSHSHDTMATLSLTYLLLAMHCWQFWRERGGWFWYVAAAVLLVLLAFTKETYYVAALFYWVAQIFKAAPGRRRAAIAFFVAVIAIELAAVVANLGARNTFIQPSANPSDPYYISLAPVSVASALSTLLGYLVTPASAVVTGLALLLAVAKKSVRLPAVVLFLAGLSALLPNSVLPNHIEAPYAWVAAVLCLSPILLVSRSGMEALLPAALFRRAGQAASAALGVLTIVSVAGWSLDRGAYDRNRWRAEQQQILGNIQDAFSRLHALPDGARNILVTGLRSPFHPFYVATYESYIAFEFGHGRRWTVTMMRDGPRGGDDLVRRVGVEDVNLSDFDYAFAFGPDGRLTRELSKHELQRTASESAIAPPADLVLIPEIQAPVGRMASDRNPWYPHLRLGLAYWEWGLTEKARRHLETAKTLDGGKNPYPFFYLGQIEEAEGGRAEAARLYREAIERQDPPNPVFKEALERVTSTPPG